MNNPALLFTDVIEKLKTTVQEGRSFDAAQVKVVGLDDIRAAAGANWDDIKERVRTNSLEFLQGCLAREDIVIPAGDGFLVLYGDASDRDLTRESAFLQDALNAFYIGEDGMQKLRAKVKGVSVDAQNMHAVLNFDGSDLAFAEDPPPTTTRPLMRAAAPLPQPKSASLRSSEHALVVAPLWSVAHEAIATYVMEPTYLDENGARHFGFDPVYRADAKHSGESFLDLDLMSLKVAVKAADRALSAGRKCIVGFHVHSTTMRGRASRNSYMAKLAAVPEELRKYLSASVAEIEPGVPMITLAEWVHAVRSILPRVSIELHPNDQNVQNLEATGAAMVSCYLPFAAHVTQEQRRNCAALLGKRVLTLHKQNLQFTVCQVSDQAIFEVACRAGVDFMSSDLLWPVVEAPMGAVKSPAANVRALFGQRRSA